jgi:hypothetical protein
MGCLLFVQTLSCPNISYVVSLVQQFFANPQRPHYHVVMRIFWYLGGTFDQGLCYDGRNAPLLLEGMGTTIMLMISQIKSHELRLNIVIEWNSCCLV